MKNKTSIQKFPKYWALFFLGIMVASSIPHTHAPNNCENDQDSHWHISGHDNPATNPIVRAVHVNNSVHHDSCLKCLSCVFIFESKKNQSLVSAFQYQTFFNKRSRFTSKNRIYFSGRAPPV